MIRLGEHLRYHVWATRRMLEAARALTVEEFARDLGSSYSGVRGTLVHIYQADRIWLLRLGGASPPSIEVPGESLGDLEEAWIRVLEDFESLAGTADAGAGTLVSYRTTKGVPYENTLEQIVMHVVNHGTYHRGQVAGMLRQLGHTAPTTDLVVFYRGN